MVKRPKKNRHSPRSILHRGFEGNGFVWHGFWNKEVLRKTRMIPSSLTKESSDEKEYNSLLCVRCDGDRNVGCLDLDACAQGAAGFSGPKRRSTSDWHAGLAQRHDHD